MFFNVSRYGYFWYNKFMENDEFENKESLPISIETISCKNLVDLIYKGESFPQEERFLSTQEGGVFKYFDPRDIINSLDNHEGEFYSLIKSGNLVIGLGELQKNPYKEKCFWIKFLSVDPEYQGKGYASKLADEMFSFAKKEGMDIETSTYTDEGYIKLKKLFNKLAKKYSIKFTDKGKM